MKMADDKSTMLCPWCGEPLEIGTFHSRGGNYFLPQGESKPTTYSEKSMEKRRAIPLTPFVGLLPGDVTGPEVYACRHCKKIVIPF